MNNLISSIFFGMFISTTIHSYVETKYNIKNSKSTEPYSWITPGIFAALYLFFNNLTLLK